jgi:hypothetical protein
MVMLVWVEIIHIKKVSHCILYCIGKGVVNIIYMNYSSLLWEMTGKNTFKLVYIWGFSFSYICFWVLWSVWIQFRVCECNEVMKCTNEVYVLLIFYSIFGSLENGYSFSLIFEISMLYILMFYYIYFFKIIVRFKCWGV